MNAIIKISAVLFLSTTIFTLPAAGVVIDPSAGNSQPMQIQKDTPQQLQEQMADPRVAPEVGRPAPNDTDLSRAPSLRTDDNSQAVAAAAAMDGAKLPATHKASVKDEAKANHLLAAAIGLAILGAICGVAILVIRKGPQAPPSTSDVDTVEEFSRTQIS